MAAERCPVYRWGQRLDSVHITLELSRVDANATSFTVTEQAVLFATERNKEQFKLALDLFASVDSDGSSMEVKDREVRIVLRKKQNVKWDSLQKPSAVKIKACEKIDWDYWKDSDDEKEEEMTKDDPLAQYLKTLKDEENPDEQSWISTMWNKYPTRHLSMQDAAFVIVLFAHLFFAPMNKVEESFNTQAVHDILFKGAHVQSYDHKQFPGVVPRTWFGAVLLSVLSWPWVRILQNMGAVKVASLYIVRMSMIFIASLAWGKFRRGVTMRFGTTAGWCLTFLTLTQFHFNYYGSRLLPNTFALWFVVAAYGFWLLEDYKWLVRLLTFAMLVFRSELLLLAGPIVLFELIAGRLTLKTLVLNGIITTIVALIITVPIDSFFWGRLLWPEGEVFWFNTVLNRSSEYGTSPPWWYFSSALPRALLTSLPLAPLALYFDRKRVGPYLIPAIAFVALYSLLPHKELRFIMYAFPLFTLAAAVVLAKFVKYSESNDGLMWLIFAYVGAGAMITGMFLTVSALNYPGGSALRQLHQIEEMAPSTYRPFVHIDAAAATTGVSQFLEQDHPWRYSKDESPSFDPKKAGVTHLITERKKVPGYKLSFKTDEFRKVIWELPVPYPDFEERIYVHRREDLAPMSKKDRDAAEASIVPPDARHEEEHKKHDDL